MKALVYAALFAAVSLAAGSFYALRAALAPLPGEWSVPLTIGPLQVEAGVPSLLRLATSSWGGPLLQGRGFDTRFGRVTFGWSEARRALQLRCAPCTVQHLTLPELNATVHRQGELLDGEAWAGSVRGRWQGELSRDRLLLKLEVPATALADGYALFAAQVPEVKQGHIAGTFSLQVRIALPAGTLQVVPRIEGFEVSGLGTEALAGARSACGKRRTRLTADHWLSRAVVAAEDQRFFDHPGYDLTELAASFARNGQALRIERGGSTLTQQVAKLLITGDERTTARKLRELLYAVEMERTLGKARILRLYLENAPWGTDGLCGAEAAAAHYYGVRAHELAPAQAAWLAAMLHNPALEAGRHNLARAQWVALGLRGLTRAKKLQLVEEMADAATSRPAPQPRHP
ncbi:MAG: transglycosylase domain-containing protein [Burkholderiales bacterium]|nr:transglycosylase domain-containing protein [Burkholderiales bacterium]